MERKPEIRKVNCCATCGNGHLAEDQAFPYIVCTIYGNRHPGEICDYFEEE